MELQVIQKHSNSWQENQTGTCLKRKQKEAWGRGRSEKMEENHIS